MPVNTHPDGTAFQNKLDEFSKKGLVGLTLVVDDPIKGFWAGASGKASIEQNIDMTKFHLQYSGSIPKMYTGTSIMLLAEDGLIELDKKMNEYLPAGICDNINNGNEITICQLMSHTSGLGDYTWNPGFYFEFMNNPERTFSTEDFLGYLYETPADFMPGEKYEYNNSNFLVLSVVIDYVTGKNHAYFFKERLFDPLNLNRTYYKIQEGYPHPTGTTNCYSDYYNDDRIINITDIYDNKWTSMQGDDGMIASTYDYMQFTRALFEGKILSNLSLETMMTWSRDPDLDDFWRNGLAMNCWRNDKRTVWGCGHSGSSEGMGGFSYYFPEKGITIALFTNTGTVHEKYKKLSLGLWEEIAELANE
ncbi:MAG: beta-lactamase family protein [Chlorobi bacterium]|nr:beta-lactamase family protein [Chlorobiota bacterium]